ncbi:MAG: SDR family NAD(P)-dependent oxidoreductase [Candidatus Dormibacteria bacterium]
MKEIGGRVAIVTGASRGLGRYIAETLFDHGVKVLMTARGADELESARVSFDRTGSRSLAIAGDITEEKHRARLVKEAVKHFGTLDILVNNAGTDDPRRITDVDVPGVRAMFDLNVVALMDMTMKVLPVLLAKGEGHIVNMGSAAGLAPVPYASIYSATKHAIVGFSESIRYELEAEGIGVSVVCPTFVSEAGLFHENSGGDTSGTPTVTPTQVADAVIKAITGNRDRVVVGPPLMRMAPISVGLSPNLTARVARMSGSFDAMRDIADRRRAERS